MRASGRYVCVQLTGTYTFVPAYMLGLPSTSTQDIHLRASKRGELTMQQTTIRNSSRQAFRDSVNRPARRGRQTGRGRRRGTVLVLFVVAMIPIVAFMAFAIDVGMLTVAQTQLRDAADAAALAGCRALNGNSANNNNYSGVAPAAQTALTANDILGNSLQTSQLTLNIGHYAYNSTAQQFQGSFPSTLPRAIGTWSRPS